MTLEDIQKLPLWPDGIPPEKAPELAKLQGDVLAFYNTVEGHSTDYIATLFVMTIAARGLAHGYILEDAILQIGVSELASKYRKAMQKKAEELQE